MTDISVFGDPIVFWLGPVPVTRATLTAFVVSAALVIMAMVLRRAMLSRPGSVLAIVAELAVEWPEQLVTDIVGRPVPSLAVFAPRIHVRVTALEREKFRRPIS
jgi:F0F1-type ATP synthase membrane subunit a